MLTIGGRLLTQHVDGHDAEEIHDWFGEPFSYPNVSSSRYVDDIEAVGLMSTMWTTGGELWSSRV